LFTLSDFSRKAQRKPDFRSALHLLSGLFHYTEKVVLVNTPVLYEFLIKRLKAFY